MTRNNDTDGDVLDENDIRERISGRHLIHRLRNWEAGDTLYGVDTFNPNTGSASGKTFRDGAGRSGSAEERARNRFERGSIATGVSVLYRATVQDVTTDPPDPHDPGEPPLKHGVLTDVEILETDRGERRGTN